MDKEKIRQAWMNYTEGKDFSLNPDSKHVDGVIDGVLLNEENYGLKLCPCRLRDGSRERDLELICPCNFKAQDTWIKEGRCWCGLFVRK